MHRLTIASLLIISCFICFPAFAQTITEKDFKLLIDGKDYTKDSTITIAELLTIKTVTTNFPWLSINELMIDFDFRTEVERKQGSVYDGFTNVYCKGNRICDDAYDKIKKLKPTNIIVFQAYEAVDKTGAKIEIPQVTFHIE